MSIRKRCFAVAILLALTLPFVLVAQQTPAAEPTTNKSPTEGPASFAQALKQGEAAVDLRLRYEDVSQDRIAKDAHALTLRTTVGYTTALYKGFQFKIEAENVAELGNDLYNNAGAGSANNRVRDRPVVADPALTEIGQVFVRYNRDDTELTLGRREVILGDSRFIGNVGWRQHHQSFDAFTFRNSSLDRVTFDYGFISRTHRIFGDSLDLSASHLSQCRDLRRAVGVGKVTALWLSARLSTVSGSGGQLHRHLGRSSSRARAKSRAERRPVADLWKLEYAHQSDARRQSVQNDRRRLRLRR